MNRPPDIDEFLAIENEKLKADIDYWNAQNPDEDPLIFKPVTRAEIEDLFEQLKTVLPC